MHRKRWHFWSIRGRNGRSLAKDRSGVTAIEFAFVAPPFFLLVFGIIEIGVAHLVNRLVDNAVVEAARLVRTGQAHSGNITAGGFKTQICDFMPPFMCDESRITVEVDAIEDFADAQSTDSLYDEDGNLREDTGYEIGGASEIVVVNVIYKWPMMSAVLSFDNGDHGNERHLTSTMVFRNEPWE
jgi:hypothetical protein